MPKIFWSSLAPRLDIPVHIHAMNPRITSFNLFESDKDRSMLIMMTFQSTSTRPMMWYSLLLCG